MTRTSDRAVQDSASSRRSRTRLHVFRGLAVAAAVACASVLVEVLRRWFLTRVELGKAPSTSPVVYVFLVIAVMILFTVAALASRAGGWRGPSEPRSIGDAAAPIGIVVGLSVLGFSLARVIDFFSLVVSEPSVALGPFARAIGMEAAIGLTAAAVAWLIARRMRHL